MGLADTLKNTPNLCKKKKKKIQQTIFFAPLLLTKGTSMLEVFARTNNSAELIQAAAGFEQCRPLPNLSAGPGVTLHASLRQRQYVTGRSLCNLTFKSILKKPSIL